MLAEIKFNKVCMACQPSSKVLKKATPGMLERLDLGVYSVKALILVCTAGKAIPDMIATLESLMGGILVTTLICTCISKHS